MKYSRFFLFVISLGLLVLLSSCQKEGSVSLHFLAEYDGQPLVLLEDYNYSGDNMINFTTSNFFISDVFLTSEDGERVELLDVDYVDFTNQNLSEAMAEEAIIINILDVAPGQYTSITISVGLDPSTNQTIPSDYTPDSPLSSSGNYWIAWDSYIFAKFQGNLFNPDVDGDNVPWLFHTGKDEVYRTFTYPIDKTIDDNLVGIQFILDHKEIFAISADDYMDIRSKPMNHNPNDIEPFIVITENFETAIKAE